jgi:hypothetical protein
LGPTKVWTSESCQTKVWTPSLRLDSCQKFGLLAFFAKLKFGAIEVVIWSPKNHDFYMPIGIDLWAIKPFLIDQTLHRTIQISLSEIEVVIWSPKTHDFYLAISTDLWAIKPFLIDQTLHRTIYLSH